MYALSIRSFVLCCAVCAAGSSLAGDYWRMEQPAKVSAAIESLYPLENDSPAAVVRSSSGGEAAYANDVVSRYIYDPPAGRAYENTSSLRLSPKTTVEVPLPEKGAPLASFTLEMYVLPATVPNRDIRVAQVSRGSNDADSVAMGIRWLGNYRQAYWAGFADLGEQRREWSTGHYVTIARLREETRQWRHLAIVYDADAKTITCYLDHWQAAIEKLDRELKFDGSPLVVGDPNFAGLVDEVRLTRSALEPADFLRAVDEPLEDVSFHSEPTALPRGTGYIDLKSGFGAIGDGKRDDTEALKRAFAMLANKVPGAYYTLYLPPGDYLVSDLMHASRFFVIQGAGRDRTTIRLADRAEGFGDPENPQPVIRASSTSGPPGSNKAVNGSSIGIYISDLTIDTGSGNPGAKGLEYHSNNHGALERVTIRSGDAAGVVGLDLTHKTNGPALIKDVRIEGFDHGIEMAHLEYSMTLEQIELLGQQKAGIVNRGNIMAIRRLRSENRVPAIISTDGRSMIVLLDSELVGGDKDATAIEAEGAFYGRNVDVEGYGKTLEKRIYVWHGWRENPKFEWHEGPTLTGDIDQWWGDETVAPWDEESAGSLELPIEETPIIPRGDIERDWLNVRDYEHLKQGNDWTPAVQLAMDSGAKTVYLPQGGYEVHGTLHLRGDIERLRGMRSSLRRPRGYEGDQPILVYDDPRKEKLAAIEHLEIRGTLHHRSPGTLVIRHSSPTSYTTAEGVGKLFMENAQATGWQFDYPQQIWVRQWNPEVHGPGPCITSHGATLWALGFKTEYESSKLWAYDGAKTEILGGFIYPVKKGIPDDRPVFRNVNSDMSLVYGMSVYVANHHLQVEETQQGETKRITTDDANWAGARLRMDLYSSRTSDE